MRRFRNKREFVAGSPVQTGTQLIFVSLVAPACVKQQVQRRVDWWHLQTEVRQTRRKPVDVYRCFFI